MPRFLKQAKQAVSKKIAPFLPVIVAAALLGALLTAIVVFAGWTAVLPTATVPAVGWSIAPTEYVFGLTVGLVLVCGGGYVLYSRNQDAIHDWWDQLSIWSRASIGGLVCGLIATLAVVASVVFSTVEPYFLPVAFFVTWPLSTTALVLYIRRRASNPQSVVTSVVVAAGYAQLKGLESRTLSLFVGLVAAIVGAVAAHYSAIWYFGQSKLLLTAGVCLVVGLAVTLLAFNYYESTTIERADLSILSVSHRPSRSVRELTIRNDASRLVDLTDSKLRDTEYDIYRLGVNMTLGPGQTCTFEIPESFSLAPNDESMDLPLGYTLKQGGETPVIFSRSGETFALQRPTDAETDSERASVNSPGLDSGPAPQD